MAPKQFQAHKLIVKTAQAMAHELYDCVMQDNELYAYWKSECEELTPKIAEKLFVKLMYPKLIEAARTTLARMLANPMLTHLHEDIYDALTKDYILRHGRLAGGAPRALLEVSKHGEVTEAPFTRKAPLTRNEAINGRRERHGYRRCRRGCCECCCW